MTREALAEASGLSVWTIRNIEQDRPGRSATITTLMALARALGTDVAVLMGQRSPNRSDSRQERRSLQAIRAVVHAPNTFLELPGVAAADSPPSLAAVRQGFGLACEHFWSGNLAELGTVLPPLLADAKAAVAASDADAAGDAYTVLGQVYELAARLAIAFGDNDLAFAVLRATLSTAGKGNDPLLAPAAVITLSTTYVRTGDYDSAQRVAVASAEQIVPYFGRGTPPARFAVWGNLLILAAVAASRNKRPDDAREYMGMAHAAAQRLGADRMDYAMHVGPTIAVMEGAGVAIRTGDVGRAIALTDTIHETGSLRPLAKSNYLLNTAYANMLAKRDDKATEILAGIHHDAPDWLRHQTLAVTMIETLYERQRTSSTIRKLARAVGMSR